MHGNQTVDWSRIDSERVSGWSRFRNGKKKTADSRYRQHGKRRSPHTRTCICIIIRLSVLILIEPFSVFIGFTWCYFYTQFFLLPVTSSSSDHVSNETPARTNWAAPTKVRILCIRLIGSGIDAQESGNFQNSRNSILSLNVFLYFIQFYSYLRHNTVLIEPNRHFL